MPEDWHVRISGPVEEYLRQAPNDVRRKLDAIFRSLEVNPNVDNFYKTYYTRLLPAVYRLWLDEEFEVVYHPIEYLDPPLGKVIHIIAVSERSDDPPTARR